MKKIKKTLTVKDRDELWDETGPYSQVRVVSETRILDDKVSRTFINVEVDINPFTFRFIKKNRHHFQNDPIIQQLLDHADYRGFRFGYVSSAFSHEYVEESVMEKAQRAFRYSQEAIIRMHAFVMDHIDSERIVLKKR